MLKQFYENVFNDKLCSRDLRRKKKNLAHNKLFSDGYCVFGLQSGYETLSFAYDLVIASDMRKIKEFLVGIAF